MIKPPPLPPDKKSKPRYRQNRLANIKQPFEILEWVNPIMAAVKGSNGFMNPATDDASAVITASEAISELLKLAIMFRFRKKPFKQDVSDLFGFKGPLGTFSARISVCAALGLAVDDLRHDLDIIRDIRNDFCHTYERRSFSDPVITSNCNKLKCTFQPLKIGKFDLGLHHSKTYTPAEKGRFIYAVLCCIASLTQGICLSYAELKFLKKHYPEVIGGAKQQFDAFLGKAFFSAVMAEAEKRGAKPHEHKTP